VEREEEKKTTGGGRKRGVGKKHSWNARRELAESRRRTMKKGNQGPKTRRSAPGTMKGRGCGGGGLWTAFNVSGKTKLCTGNDSTALEGGNEGGCF